MDSSGGGVALLNHLQFQSALRIEFGRARRHDLPLSCIALAIDGFAERRRREGEAGADAVVAAAVELLQSQLRASDLLGWFNDTFYLVLPHATLEGACAVAERVRALLSGAGAAAGAGRHRLLTSAGIASLAAHPSVLVESLPKSAELALEQARSRGGGQVVVAGAVAAG